jgi:pimeloyl-ACP methyl ester carboxylesterase
MLNYNPEVEPEFFNRCPVLLAHPENDRWTDLSLSKITFDKFQNNKDIVILKGAGHFPIELPGLKQLETQSINFINKILLSSFAGSNH